MQIQDKTKRDVSLSWPLERRWIFFLTPRLPRFLNGHNLTLLSLAWSALALLAAYLAQGARIWIWAAVAAILLQYFTDCLDGAVGRYRNSGLAKWGYVMDHFFDYIFIASLFVGYAFLVSGSFQFVPFALFIIVAGFMVYSCLMYGVSHEFQMSSFLFGPTEARVILILLDIAFFFFGFAVLDWGLLGAAVFCFILLVSAVYTSERQLYKDRNSSPGPKNIQE